MLSCRGDRSSEVSCRARRAPAINIDPIFEFRGRPIKNISWTSFCYAKNRERLAVRLCSFNEPMPPGMTQPSLVECIAVYLLTGSRAGVDEADRLPELIDLF
jgi:hypothetical protein